MDEETWNPLEVRDLMNRVASGVDPARTATTVWRRGYTDDPGLRQEFLAEVRNRKAWT
jgi:hypothetical protein